MNPYAKIGIAVVAALAIATGVQYLRFMSKEKAAKVGDTVKAFPFSKKINAKPVGQ